MTRPRNPQSWEKFIQKTKHCWIWTGAHGGKGMYAVYTEYIAPPNGTITHRANRFIWVQLKGPIPEGLELHHTCGNHSCVNPDCQELLTHAEHSERHRKALCKNGHDQTKWHYFHPRTGYAHGCILCREGAWGRHAEREIERLSRDDS